MKFYIILFLCDASVTMDLVCCTHIKKPRGISDKKSMQRRTKMNKLNDEVMKTVNGGGGDL